jgi:mono/diheme cytochrome c family protein
MVRTPLAVCSALAALCAAAPGWAQTAEENLAAEGREEFVQYCASCHGTDARGDGPLADDLRVPPADLTQVSARHGGVFPEAMIAEVIDGRRRVRAHGSAEMPVWGHRFQVETGTRPASDFAVRGRTLLLVEYLGSIQAKAR